MTDDERPQPTNAELEILQVLWARGPSTVREVQGDLARDSGYTTVLKLLQIMTEKGLVARDESSRAHVYEARVSEERVQRDMVDELLRRAFDGSSSRLVLHALAAAPASAEELDRIRDLLEELDAADPPPEGDS